MNYVKVFCLALLVGLSACDKTPDGVVENNSVDYLLTKLDAPDNFTNTSADSSVITSLQISNPKSVDEIWCTIKLLKNQQIVFDKVELSDDGERAINGDIQKDDNIYTGKFVMSKQLSSGDYVIEYYIKDNVNVGEDNVAKVAVHQFRYSNGKNNNPPVISDLVMPSSVQRNESFVINLKATDKDGMKDISQVEFNLYQPSGAFIGKFSLMDDGKTTDDGDLFADDGIYSSKRSFKTEVTTGVWRFVFLATDFPGATSNTITFDLLVN